MQHFWKMLRTRTLFFIFIIYLIHCRFWWLDGKSNVLIVLNNEYGSCVIGCAVYLCVWCTQGIWLTTQMFLWNIWVYYIEWDCMYYSLTLHKQCSLQNKTALVLQKKTWINMCPGLSPLFEQALVVVNGQIVIVVSYKGLKGLLLPQRQLWTWQRNKSSAEWLLFYSCFCISQNFQKTRCHLNTLNGYSSDRCLMQFTKQRFRIS